MKEGREQEPRGLHVLSDKRNRSAAYLGGSNLEKSPTQAVNRERNRSLRNRVEGGGTVYCRRGSSDGGTQMSTGFGK